MDPATIALVASLAGSFIGPMLAGDGGERHAYTGGVQANRTLEDALTAIKGYGRNLETRGPVQLRTTMPKPASPVSIPGLNFQIGGGLGHDPAIDDPSMLMGRAQSGPNASTPFQSLFAASNGPSTPGLRQRSPVGQSTVGSQGTGAGATNPNLPRRRPVSNV